jgi:hypothetical protein
MPSYNLHKKVGFWVSLIILIILTYLYKSIPLRGWKFWITIPIIAIYANLPDLDHSIGKLRKYTFQVIFLSLTASILVYALLGIIPLLLFVTFIGILGYAIMNTKHRGIMHSYWFALIISSPLIYVHYLVTLFAFVSISSHILIDRIYSTIKVKLKKWFHIHEKNQFTLFEIKQIKVGNREF